MNQLRTEPGLVDRAVLCERYADDPALLEDLVELFRADAPRSLQILRDALAAGDARRVQRTAHKLRGSLLCFAAPAVVALAERLESLGEEGKLGEAEELLMQLQSQVERLLAELSTLLPLPGLSSSR